MRQGTIIWDKRARLVFYLTRHEGQAAPDLVELLARVGVGDARRADDQVIGTWHGAAMEAQLDALPYHFVLQLAIHVDAYLERIGVRSDRSGPVESDPAIGFVRAFAAACAALAPEAAFVVRNPSSAVTAAAMDEGILDQEPLVLSKDAMGLAAEDFSLLYLDDELAARLLPSVDRDELPVAQGRLLFAGRGAHRIF